MNLAPGYNWRLRRYNPDLRVRWSPSREVWLLESRARYRRAINPALYDEHENDTFRQVADGYFTLGIYQPRDLPTVDRLIDYLKSQDTWALGKTAEQIADELDADYEARRAKRRRDAVDDAGHMAGEYHDALKVQAGERAFVPPAFSGS